MIKVSIEGKVYEIPTEKSEVSLKQYVSVCDWARGADDSAISLVSLLSGMDIDDAVSCAHIWQDRIDFEGIMSLRLIESDKSKAIEINGERLKPKETAMLKVGQRVVFHQVIKAVEQGASIESQLARVLAIGFGFEMHGKSWASNISLSESIMEEQKAVDVLPIAYFFLRTYCFLKSNGTLSNSLLTRYSLMQGGKGFKNMASSIRLSMSQKITGGR